MCKLVVRLTLMSLGLLLLSGKDTRAMIVRPRLLECQDAVNSPGYYGYLQRHTERNPEVCLTVLRADENKKIEVRLKTNNVNCSGAGEIAFIDGLTLQNDYFPGLNDAEVPASKRMTVLCDTEGPYFITSNQNVASILFRFPKAGRGFTVSVRHIPNPEPCNVIAPQPNATGYVRIQNYGHRRNCSYLILYPTEFAVMGAKLGRISGLQCDKGSDFFEIRSGDNIDPLKSTARVADSCQLALAKRVAGTRAPLVAASPCYASVVRLVSSGRTNNEVLVKHKPMNLKEASQRCRLG